MSKISERYSVNEYQPPARCKATAVVLCTLALVFVLLVPATAMAWPNPVPAGSAFTGSPGSVYVEGGYAYVVSYYSSTLRVFDVSNPASPSLMGSAGTGNYPTSVCVQGGYAYVANNWSNSLQVFDVSDPASPSPAGSTTTGTYPASVCAQGGYAYVVNTGGNTLQVFLLWTATTPTVATTISSDVTSTTASSGGDVTDAGGDAVTCL
jgi:hypothetical protein